MTKIIGGRTERHKWGETRVLIVEMWESHYHLLRRAIDREINSEGVEGKFPFIEDDWERRKDFEVKLAQLPLRPQVANSVRRSIVVPYSEKPFPQFEQWAAEIVNLWKTYGANGHKYLVYRNLGGIGFTQLAETLIAAKAKGVPQ